MEATLEINTKQLFPWFSMKIYEKFGDIYVTIKKFLRNNKKRIG